MLREDDTPEHIGTILSRVLASALVAAARDPQVRALLRELRDDVPTCEPVRLLTAAELAKRIGVSVAHVRRLDPPALIVGDVSTRRYDLAAVRTWLGQREPKATTSQVRAVKGVNVDDIAAAAGLRAIPGGRL